MYTGLLSYYENYILDWNINRYTCNSIAYMHIYIQLYNTIRNCEMEFNLRQPVSKINHRLTGQQTSTYIRAAAISLEDTITAEAGATLASSISYVHACINPVNTSV